MQQRPKIILTVGRINQPLQVPNGDLLQGNVPKTFLNINTGSGATTLTLKNTSGFSASLYPFVIIGEIGNQGTELVAVTSIDSITGITLANATAFPHSAGTPIYAIKYNQVELSHSQTVTGDKTTIVLTPLTTDETNTVYYDESVAQYYFARFISSITQSITSITRVGTLATATKVGHGFVSGQNINITGANQSEYNGYHEITVLTSSTFTFTVSGTPTTPATGTILASLSSTYSDPAPVDGYTIYSARAIIDDALGQINKETSEVLSDSFAFTQLDSFQTDVLKEQKRWSFMQKFDEIIGQFNVGEWKIPMPTDIDDLNTTKSVYNIRVGTSGRLTWIDKAKWDDFIFNLAYTTLAVDLEIGATTMILTNSGDFNHLTATNTDGSGNVIIGANTYEYSANDVETGILTLTTAITSDNTASAGQDVFQNANQGLPNYYTIWGGYVYYWPITSAEYAGNNAFMDYYSKQLRISRDSDEIVVPDAVAASDYLQWKFLKKLNNGDESQGSLAAMKNYLARRETLKTKASKNRTFKLNPRYQNFAIQEQWDSGDPRYIRDGAFPNTGF